MFIYLISSNLNNTELTTEDVMKINNITMSSEMTSHNEMMIKFNFTTISTRSKNVIVHPDLHSYIE